MMMFNVTLLWFSCLLCCLTMLFVMFTTVDAQPVCFQSIKKPIFLTCFWFNLFKPFLQLYHPSECLSRWTGSVARSLLLQTTPRTVWSNLSTIILVLQTPPFGLWLFADIRIGSQVLHTSSECEHWGHSCATQLLSLVGSRVEARCIEARKR